MRLVVNECYRKTLHFSLDRLTRVPGHDDHLVNAGATEGDELPVYERYPLKPYERLRHATHAPTFAGCQQHRANAQSWVQSAALFKQASHNGDSQQPASRVQVRACGQSDLRKRPKKVYAQIAAGCSVVNID